jgi:hypothetical protein
MGGGRDRQSGRQSGQWGDKVNSPFSKCGVRSAELGKVQFPPPPSFVKSTTAGKPALSPGEREHRQRSGALFWSQPIPSLDSFMRWD